MPSLVETIAIAMEQAARGRLPQAMEDLRRQLPQHPDSADLHHSIGVLALRSGQLDQGLFHFERAAALGRPRADYITNYGTTLNMKGRAREAAEQFRRAAGLAPSFFPAQVGLASALVGAGDYAGAIDAARAAAAAAPGRPDPWYHLGVALMRAGRTGEAVSALHQALASMRDHPLLLSVLVQALNHRPEADPRVVFEEHQRLGRIVQQLVSGLYPSFENPDPERPLRVGYVSQDFREGPVAAMIEPVLAGHTGAFETFCYSACTAPDAATKRLQKLARHWTDISRLGDDSVERAVRGDNIDLLIDLSGHTIGTRIAAFARRLAPVQISYLGYPNTTGIRDMDYRIVDGRTDPEGAEAFSTEKLIRIEGGSFCFRPTPDAPDVTPRAGGAATFGCFAEAAGVNEATVEAWARLLSEVPGSRLVLSNTALTSAAVRDEFLARFTKLGVEPARVELRGAAAGVRERLGLHAGVDVALDTFPCGAPASACEALYMGVPVVTLEGTTHAGRRTASVLASAGAGEFIAGNVDDYVSKAAGLANDAKRLAELRGSLRERVRASALCDGAGFTRKLEGAYRGAWRAWCARQ